MHAAAHTRSRLKTILLALGGVVLLIVIGLVAFVMLFDFAGYIQRKASGESGREVVLEGKTHIDWSLKPRLTVEGLRIGNMAGAKEPLMASADKLVVSLDTRALLRGRIVLPEVILDNPDILLEKDKDGNANWHFGSNPEGKAVDAVTPDSRAEIPVIGRLSINHGRLRYKDATANIDIDAALATIQGKAKEKQDITILGKGMYKNRPFKLDFTGGSVLTLHDTGEPYPLKADIAVADTTANIEGTVMDPLQLKGLELKLQVAGKNAADIFPILGIALPPTPPYRLTGNLGLEEGVWQFTGFTGRLGNSDLAGDLSWDTRPEARPIFTAQFTSKLLDYSDLAGLIGATPQVRADSSAEQKQQAAQQAHDSRVLPDVPLDISRMKAMDARVEFTGKKIKATDLPLDDFYMKLALDNSLLTLTPVKFGTASGDIVATMEINARKEPVAISGDFKFRRLALSRLFGGLEESLNAAPTQGYIGGTATLRGHGKSLRDMLASANGAIGLGMEGGQLSNLIVEILGLDVAEGLGFLMAGDRPVAVRCVIGDFAVTKGLMQSNAIMIDTADTKVTGKGTLNLKNEQMDILLHAQPKDPSLLSLKTPIQVGGTLGVPAVGIKAENLAARGAVAGALGVVFLPAALLAFIEPGLGKDGDCAQLLAEMQVNTGKKPGQMLIPKNN